MWHAAVRGSRFAQSRQAREARAEERRYLTLHVWSRVMKSVAARRCWVRCRQGLSRRTWGRQVLIVKGMSLDYITAAGWTHSSRLANMCYRTMRMYPATSRFSCPRNLLCVCEQPGLFLQGLEHVLVALVSRTPVLYVLRLGADIGLQRYERSLGREGFCAERARETRLDSRGTGRQQRAPLAGNLG